MILPLKMPEVNNEYNSDFFLKGYRITLHVSALLTKIP